MQAYFVNWIAIVVMCILLTGVNSTPFGNRWNPTDYRCKSDSVRIGRSVTTNNDSGKSYWAYNGNSGSCEKQHSSAGAFSSKAECDRACLNVYHFS